jgi:hypothetical protein
VLNKLIILKIINKMAAAKEARKLAEEARKLAGEARELVMAAKKEARELAEEEARKLAKEARKLAEEEARKLAKEARKLAMAAEEEERKFAIEVVRKAVEDAKKKDPNYFIVLRKFCEDILNNSNFKVYKEAFIDLKSIYPEKVKQIFKIMIDCALELFHEIVILVQTELNKKIEEKLKIETKEIELNSKILTNELAVYYISTCLIIALKMYGAYDWIRNREKIMPAIVKNVKELVKVTLDPEILVYLENYILEMTHWVGCDSYKLSKNYDDDFEDEKDDSIDGNVYNVSKSFKKDIWELLDKLLEKRIESIFIHLKNTYLSKEEIDSIEADVKVDVNADVEAYISETENLSEEQIEDYNKNGKNSEVFKSMVNEFIKLKLIDIEVEKFLVEFISDGDYTEKQKKRIRDYISEIYASRKNDYIKTKIKLFDTEVKIQKEFEEFIHSGEFEQYQIDDYEAYGKNSAVFKNYLQLYLRRERARKEMSIKSLSKIKKMSKSPSKFKKMSKSQSKSKKMSKSPLPKSKKMTKKSSSRKSLKKSPSKSVFKKKSKRVYN